MKKRLFAIALTVALLVTLVPFGSLEAKAASNFVASEGMVNALKKWEGFSKKPYWDYGQWTVGYGTSCPAADLDRYKANGITEAEATKLLENHLASKGKSVNSFIDKYNLKVTQGMFDAMLSLTYNCGPKWMYQVSTLRTAIMDGWTGNDLIFAFGQWSTAAGVTLNALVRRRLAEANMYLNGEYSSTPPSNYCFVRFEPNGGTCEIKTQGYNSDTPTSILAVPTYDNYVFEGWYTDATGGEKVTTLDASVKGYKLYAHWSAGNGKDHPQDPAEEVITGTPVDYVREVTAGSLNAFESPVKGAMVVDAYTQYGIVEIVAEYVDGSGIKWGKVKKGGWINLEYTQEPVADDESNGVKVTVNANNVNIRRGPSTSYTSVSQADKGDELIITRTVTAGGYNWGKCSKGWIALKYTNYDDAVNENLGGNTGSTEQVPAKVMGTVKVDDYLCVRSGAGTGNPMVTKLTNGTRVEILEQKAVGGSIWGRIESGWISLNYVVLDTASAPEQTPDETPDNTPDETPDQTPDDTPDQNPGQNPDNTPEQTPDNTPDDSQTQAPENTPEQKPAAVKGTVKGNGLRIRKGPSTGYDVVGSYNSGDRVEILEQETVGATIWGRTEKGWISLDYVKLDEDKTPTETPDKTPEETPDNSTDKTPEETPDNDTEQKPAQQITGKIVLNSGRLNVRSGPGSNYGISAYLSNGTKVTVTEQKTVGSTTWGKCSKGWFSMAYFRADEVQATKATGTVDVDGTLRVRSGPGTGYTISGYVSDGDRVELLEQKVVGSYTWGRISKGWIRLDYVVLDEGVSSPTSKTGTVTTNGLRIRVDAGTGKTIVGSLNKGEKVKILETKTVNGTLWGKIDEGWISMDYVKVN